MKYIDMYLFIFFGAVSLVPNDAIIQEYPKPSTIADMRRLMSVSSAKRRYSDTNPLANDEVTIGCGNFDLERDGETTAFASYGAEQETSPALPAKRRLSMVPDASYCNNSTNFYCWMTCQDIPNKQNAAQLMKDGKSLYCLDTSALFKYGGDVAEAVSPCEDPETGTPGGAMNTNCIGSWQPTAPNVPAQDVIINSTQPFDAQPFCYGATSMYMEGFQWRGVVCVVYLFPFWIISSQWKMIASCIATIFLAVLLEGVIFARKAFVNRLPRISVRIFVSTLMYGCQLTLAYFIMLVVMTYSVPLFVSVIVGLMTGHLGFSVIGKEGMLFDEGATPCCLSDVTPIGSILSDKRKSGARRETDIVSESDVVSYKTFSESGMLSSLPEQFNAGGGNACLCETDIESY
jgi:copper transporter 1